MKKRIISFGLAVFVLLSAVTLFSCEEKLEKYSEYSFEYFDTVTSITGYEKSQEVSVNSQIANAISSEILKKTSYNLTEALGGQNSKTASVNEEELERNEYQSSVKYSAGSSEKKSWSKKAYLQRCQVHTVEWQTF